MVKQLLGTFLKCQVLIAIDGVGQITLTDEDVAKLNAELTKKVSANNWKMTLHQNLLLVKSKKWLLIQIVTTWNICQVQISDDKTVQIVAGAQTLQLV